MNKLEKFSWVETYWENDHKECDSCPFLRMEKEPHGEHSGGCLLLDKPFLYPIDGCPALTDFLIDESVDDALAVPRGIINALALTAAIGLAITTAVVLLVSFFN